MLVWYMAAVMTVNLGLVGNLCNDVNVLIT